MKIKKILGLLGLLSASAVASMCVIPHVDYNENVAKTNQVFKSNSQVYSSNTPFLTGTNANLGGGSITLSSSPSSFNVWDENYNYDYGEYYSLEGLPFAGIVFISDEVGYSIKCLGNTSFDPASGIENDYTVYAEGAYEVVNYGEIVGDLKGLSGQWLYIPNKDDFYLHFSKAMDDYAFSAAIASNWEVGDIQAPSIDGQNYFIVNVNNMLSKEEILSNISAVDDTDGIVEVVIDSTDYDPLNRKVGDYTMNVSASDKAGNKTTAVITIKVVDIDKPVISGTNSYTVEYDAPVSLDTIKGALTVSDNYDTGLELQLIQDNYTGHEREVGVHTITFKSVDSSKNESDVYTVTVNVRDTKKPVISAPGTINVPTNKLFTLDELKAKISVSDGLDGPITEYEIVGYENYQANYKTVGTYTINITAKDKNNNTATAIIKIITSDSSAPDIWFNDHFIILGQGEQLTDEMIKEYASKALGIDVEDIVEVVGDYDTNEVGNYDLTIKTVDGNEYVFKLNVDESTIPNDDFEWPELETWQWVVSGAAGVLILAGLVSVSTALFKRKRR